MFGKLIGAIAAVFLVGVAAVATTSPASALLIRCDTLATTCDGDYNFDATTDIIDSTFTIENGDVIDWMFVDPDVSLTTLSNFLAWYDSDTTNIWLSGTVGLGYVPKLPDPNYIGNFGVVNTDMDAFGNKWRCNQVQCASFVDPSIGDYVVTAIPEPSSILLFGVGLIGLVGIGRRRRNQTEAA